MAITHTTATEEMLRQQYQNAATTTAGNMGQNLLGQSIISPSRLYRADRWETGTATTRFTVTKASNGYILEAGDEIYVADTVEQVQGIVATLLIAKGE
jgi:hypothetical protein